MASVAEIIRDIFNEDDDDMVFEGFNPEDIESDIDLQDALQDLSDSEGSEDEPEVHNPGVAHDGDGEWTSDFTDINVDAFLRETGPKLPPDFDVNTSSPLDYFNLFFTQQQYVNIARHTNNYARWRMETESRNDAKWSDTDASEIKSFIAINILMGIQYMPESDMYW